MQSDSELELRAANFGVVLETKGQLAAVPHDGAASGFLPLSLCSVVRNGLRLRPMCGAGSI